jgi:hypothetical protein
MWDLRFQGRFFSLLRLDRRILLLLSWFYVKIQFSQRHRSVDTAIFWHSFNNISLLLVRKWHRIILHILK